MLLIVEYRDAYGAGMRRAPRASGGGSTSERLVPIGRLVAAVSVRNDQRTVAGGGGSVPTAAAAMEVNEDPRCGRLRPMPRQVAFIRAVTLGRQGLSRELVLQAFVDARQHTAPRPLSAADFGLSVAIGRYRLRGPLHR
jgi:hypothetical protein